MLSVEARAEAEYLLDEIAPDRMTQPMVEAYNAEAPEDQQLDLNLQWMDEGMWLECHFYRPLNGTWQGFIARYANWPDDGWALVILDNEGWECMTVKATERTLH